MPLVCLFVDDSTVAADLHSLTVVALMGRDELDAAVLCRWLCQSTNAATHWHASCTLANVRLG